MTPGVARSVSHQGALEIRLIRFFVEGVVIAGSILVLRLHRFNPLSKVLLRASVVGL